MNIQMFPFDFQGCTVDGSEILCHQLRLVVSPIIYRVLYIVVGLIGSIKSIGKKKVAPLRHNSILPICARCDPWQVLDKNVRGNSTFLGGLEKKNYLQRLFVWDMTIVTSM